MIRGAKGAGSPNDSMIARGPRVERDIQQRRLLGKAPGDEADAERIGDTVQAWRSPASSHALVTVAAAKNAKAAGSTDGRGEPCCPR